MRNASEVLKDIKAEQETQINRVAMMGDASIQTLLYAISEGYKASFKDGAALIRALHGSINPDIEGVYFDFSELEDVGVEMSMAIAKHAQEIGSEPYGMADFHKDGLGML